MNNLSQLGRQILAIWKQLGLNQRISIVLSAAAVVAGLASLAWFSGRKDYALLYGRLDEAEAGKVVAALAEAKIPYQVKAGGSILVPSDKVHPTRMQLAAKGLPQAQGGVGFEIFDRPNFGISDFVQRANYSRALQGELSRTIAQLDMVESARVLIVLPENRLIVDQLRKPTASVFVKVRGSADLPSSAVNSIRFLVANSVEGLAVNHVSVVDHRGNVLTENHENDSIAGMSSGQFGAKRNVEQYLTRKAEGMLDRVLGPGMAVVRVAADINWDSITRTEEKFDPENQILRTEVVDEESTLTSTSEGGGPAGLASNQADPNADPAAEAPAVNSSNTRKKTSNRAYEINKTTSSILQAAGGIKKVTASVMVAQNFTGTGAERQAAPRTPEELNKLRLAVANAIGSLETDVVLEELPFNDQPAVEIAGKLEQQEKMNLYLDLAQKALYPGVALLLGFMFFRTLRKTKADDLPTGVPIGDLYPDGVGSDGMGMPVRRKKEEVVTVEVLNRLIRENPSSMTQAVRTWMTRSENGAQQPPANTK